MKQQFGYFGYLEHYNLGDEAIYLANKKLFSQYDLVPYQYSNIVSVGLLGGGTLLPPTKRLYQKITDFEYAAAIGAGVKDPELRNQKFRPIELSYFLGKINKNEILRKRSVSYLLRPVSHAFESVGTGDHYINEKSFRRLEAFDRIGVRGPLSKQLLEDRGIRSEVTGDTALLLEPSEYNNEDTDKVAITLRPGGFKWHNDTEYLDTIREFCESYSDEYEFVFVPFNPTDIPFHIDAAERIPNASYRGYCSLLDIESTLQLYADCDAVIGERLHAAVLSACCYTPFLAIEYRTKVRDFVESIEMGEYSAKNGDITVGWIETKLDNIVGNRDHRHRLQQNVDDRRSELEAFSEEICEDTGRL